jgi:hypothetical protein
MVLQVLEFPHLTVYAADVSHDGVWCVYVLRLLDAFVNSVCGKYTLLFTAVWWV